MASKNDLYNKLVAITSDYLGPAANRFIDRQIQNHLNKEPQAVTIKDLELLNDWMKISVALLTENPKIRKEYAKRLASLLPNENQHQSI